ncbi:MAG: hypothetical protein ABIH23_03150 [bacterium]
MPSICLFGEDEFHEIFIQALVQRLSQEYQIPITMRPYSVRGGITKMHYELGQFLRDLRSNAEDLPDAILAATDANCAGYVDRGNLLEGVLTNFPQFQYLMIYAIPDPHVERWMMADAEAFRRVFGKGCTLPARKCERALYKKLLAEEILKAGMRSALGGREFAEDIVREMNLPHAGQNEASLGRLLADLRGLFNRWGQVQ